MSEEVNTTNWPDPTRPGYYWLKCRTEAQSELEIFYWDKDAQVFSGIGDVGCVDEICFSEHWEYHGPVKTPTQISEMLAAERERCASICGEYTPDKSSIAGDSFLTGRYLALAGVADKIRNLGAAS